MSRNKRLLLDEGAAASWAGSHIYVFVNMFLVARLQSPASSR